MFKGLCFIFKKKVCNAHCAPECSEKVVKVGSSDNGQARAQRFNLFLLSKYFSLSFTLATADEICIKNFGSSVICEQCGRE